jgi:RNA polymerase sigma-70 factor (ECF subfamily)
MDTGWAKSTDVELLRTARRESAAFGEFYRRHAVTIEHWVRLQTPDMATAADLTAETFAQALVGLGRFRGSTDDAARAWLFGIARNLVRRYHPRGRVETATCRKLGFQPDYDPDELARADAQIDASARSLELSRALGGLPATQRQALELRVIDDLDYREAAAVMGTTEHNARARVSRALKALSLRMQGVSQ